VAGASGDPDNGFKWVTEVEGQGANLAHLYDSAPFHTLDAKLAASLTKIMSGEFARQIYILMEERASKGKFLKGRQILLLLYQHYKISEVDGQMLDFQDLVAVHMVGEELRRFMNDWEMTLTGMRKLPEEDVLETLFRRQIQRHPGFREHMYTTNVCPSATKKGIIDTWSPSLGDIWRLGAGTSFVTRPRAA
jgi:hypothetical protein